MKQCQISLRATGLRTSKQLLVRDTFRYLPVRDTFVLPPFNCLIFLVPSRSYTHLEKTDRGKQRRVVAVLGVGSGY